MFYFKTTSNGTTSYGTASDEAMIPDGAALFPDQASVDAEIDALRNPPLTLVQVQAKQTGLLTASCAAAISAGFTSSALGAPHNYPNAATDQLNMIASITASLLPGLPAGWTTPFWCQDPTSGVWTLTPHTAVQIQQAGLDGKAAVIAAQNKLIALKAQVAAATSAAAVAAIVWA